MSKHSLSSYTDGITSSGVQACPHTCTCQHQQHMYVRYQASPRVTSPALVSRTDAEYQLKRPTNCKRTVSLMLTEPAESDDLGKHQHCASEPPLFTCTANQCTALNNTPNACVVCPDPWGRRVGGQWLPVDDEPPGISWWMTPNPLFRSLLVWASLTIPVSSEPPAPSASSQVKRRPGGPTR